MAIAEAAVAHDALGLILAIFEAAADLLGGHAASDWKSEM